MDLQNNDNKENRFDKIAREWDGDSMRTRLAAAIAESIRVNHPISGATLLDFGCGTGLVSFPFSEHFNRIEGVDTSLGMVEQFNQKAEKFSIDAHARLYIPGSPLPAEHYDVVVSGMVLHHIEDVSFEINEIYRSLKPGGVVALADLDLEDGTFHPAEMEGIFHNGFDRSQIREWLEQAGFGSISLFDAYSLEKEGKTFTIFLATARKP